MGGYFSFESQEGDSEALREVIGEWHYFALGARYGAWGRTDSLFPLNRASSRLGRQRQASMYRGVLELMSDTPTMC